MAKLYPPNINGTIPAFCNDNGTVLITVPFSMNKAVSKSEVGGFALKIKTVSGPDDYACMKEVLTRRFLHGLEEKAEFKKKEIDVNFGSFTKFPDLLLMDGGKGQVNIAKDVLADLGIVIPVCGMVKDDNHRTRGLYFDNVEITMEKSSEGFRLITRIQDEAHRFAIEFHRSLRHKSTVHSTLDEIKGVGPSRRKALMKYFMSISEMRDASVEKLQEVPGITQTVAEEIHRFFHDKRSI